jgi:hypothetical protein
MDRSIRQYQVLRVYRSFASYSPGKISKYESVGSLRNYSLFAYLGSLARYDVSSVVKGVVFLA